MPKCDFNKAVKLLCNFIEVALRHGWSPVNLLHVFRTSFLKNTSEGLLVSLLVFIHHEIDTYKLHLTL